MRSPRRVHAMSVAVVVLVLALPAALACGPAARGQAPSGNALDAEHRNSPPLRTLEGRVSYYSDRLAGNHTANGDIYDPELYTAASRDLPFGTIVRVVRADDGRAVTVRVNDRGPFGDRRRILDLSRAAAEQLGMIREGVIQVRAEILLEGDGRRNHRR